MDIQKSVEILDQVVPKYLKFMQTHQGSYDWMEEYKNGLH